MGGERWLWGFLEQQDCAALKGLQSWVTLVVSLATLVSWLIWSGPRYKKKK